MSGEAQNLPGKNKENPNQNVSIKLITNKNSRKNSFPIYQNLKILPSFYQRNGSEKNFSISI